jgi:alpha-galactosidase
MVKTLPFLLLAVAAAGIFALAPVAQEPAPAIRAGFDGLGLTPPMGWYPWNMFGEDPQTEALIKEIADAMVTSGLRDAGYAYVGPDEGICFSRGADGRLTPNLARYPSGLRGLGDYIHSLGLKYALYTDAGTRTCSGAMPGTRGREVEDMRAFADWRADYIKIDWCNTEGQDIVQSYAALDAAQRAVGRPLVHSLCSWGEGSPWLWAARFGHLWRTTSDICAPGRADWELALRVAFANERLSAHAGPGRWNDPDMMIVGMPGLSDAQNRSLFSLWCVMAAPLIAGNDLRTMTPETAAILTNPEAIAIDQDPFGVQGRILWTDGNVSIWGGKRLFDGSQAVLVFNRSRHPADARIDWKDLGIDPAARCFVRNLWTRRTQGPLTGGLSVGIAPDDVVFLRIAPSDDFPRPPVLWADSYRVALRAESRSPRTLTGSIKVTNGGSAELPFWTIGGGLPRWLSVRVVKDGRSQVFVNTVATAGLKKGLYHALVRADNVEPVSGLPMTSLYYDVDLEVVRDVGR